MASAQLVLESGECFSGAVPEWVSGRFFGEVVFNTGMVGYTEVLTDPSYRGQIVVFTYPLIGNYGVEPASHWESEQIHAAGVVVSELAGFHARSEHWSTLEEWCHRHGVPILYDTDTRALTRVLRDTGVVAGAIVANDQQPREFVDINEQNLVAQVSIDTPRESGEGSHTLVVVDCGIKANILRYLHAFPVRIKRVPYDYDYSAEDCDGIFISNGPGDPRQCQATVDILKKAMQQAPARPVFGICLGAQLLSLAVGGTTYKMKFGHRAQNHPCLLEGSERCYLTSQNHGYAIAEHSLSDDWEVMFRNLNDNTVQGVRHKTLPYSAVQFHPEAGPGPVDTTWLFDRFVRQVAETEPHVAP